MRIPCRCDTRAPLCEFPHLKEVQTFGKASSIPYSWGHTCSECERRIYYLKFSAHQTTAPRRRLLHIRSITDLEYGLVKPYTVLISSPPSAYPRVEPDRGRAPLDLSASRGNKCTQFASTIGPADCLA